MARYRPASPRPFTPSISVFLWESTVYKPNERLAARMETTRHYTATVYIVADGATALHEHKRL